MSLSSRFIHSPIRVSIYQQSFEYLSLLILFILALIIIGVLLFVSFIITPQYPYIEKLSSYECGFQPFGCIREQQDIHFYKVAIAYLIFDIEIIFLTAWAINLNYVGIYGYISMLGFFLFLVMSYMYEYVTGTLDWN